MRAEGSQPDSVCVCCTQGGDRIPLATMARRWVPVVLLVAACGLSVDGRRLSVGNDSKVASDDELGRQLKGRGGRRGRRPAAPPPPDAGGASAALGGAPVAV